MSGYGDDDEYGYDPDRERKAKIRAHLKRHEAAAERVSSGPQQLGDVIPLPKVTRTTKRRLDSHVEILAGPPDLRDVQYLHTVLCQTGLPYRATEERQWLREQGNVSLLVEAGHAMDPRTGKLVQLGLPYGERPRLVLIHLNTQAVKTGSPVIDVGASMTSFCRSLGIDTNGPSLRLFKQQLASLAAARVTFGLINDECAVTINTQIVTKFELWLSKVENQRVLWPSTVQLGAEYFASLVTHAVPLDYRAIAKLAGSALALDVYCWLAQRLHRVPKGKSQKVTWLALRDQFGSGYDRDRLDNFRSKFAPVLKLVLSQYPAARVDNWIERGRSVGLILHHSKPPVPKRLVQLSQRGGMLIDAIPVGHGDPD